MTVVTEEYFTPFPQAVADMIHELADGAQFITTTFRPELIHSGDQFYGVTHRNKSSTIRTIDKTEAMRIITEDQSRARQHAEA